MAQTFGFRAPIPLSHRDATRLRSLAILLQLPMYSACRMDVSRSRVLQANLSSLEFSFFGVSSSFPLVAFGALVAPVSRSFVGSLSQTLAPVRFTQTAPCNGQIPEGIAIFEFSPEPRERSARIPMMFVRLVGSS